MASLKLDSYVIQVLMRDLTGHDHRPSAFLVYLYFWSQTLGAGRRSAFASLRQIAEATGLSKSAVQAALKRLTRREEPELQLRVEGKR